MPKATYDPEAQALYAYLRHEEVELTMEFANGRVFIDFDSNGSIIGVEVLGIEAVVDVSEKPVKAPQVAKEQLQLV